MPGQPVERRRETSPKTSTRPPQLGLSMVAIFLPLFLLYVGTGNRGIASADTLANTLTAWSLATKGSPVLDQHAELAGRRAWIVPSPLGPVSQYPPGAAALAVPAYALFVRSAPLSPVAVLEGDAVVDVIVPMPNPLPALVVAAATTAGAMAFIGALVLELGARPRAAILAGLIAGLATSAWTVAGDALWQHGPNMLWLAVGIWLGVRGKWLLAGLSFAALTLTRPPVVLVGIALGLMLLRRRELRSALLLLVGALPGAVGILLYNRWVFGTGTVTGGYSISVGERLVETETFDYLTNVAAAFVASRYGLFVWSPFLALLVVGVFGVRKQIPTWAVAAGLGGLAYLLLQLRLNSAAGGFGFHYYRYPLETLAACSPALYLAWQWLWEQGNRIRIALGATTAYSILVHALVAIP